MKRIVYRSILAMGLAIGVASFIGIISFAQCCPACISPPIQNIRVDNTSGVPKVEFEVTRWVYVYIFDFRPGVGWEATYPIVASQVKRYSPGCHTIPNGMIRYATKIRIVVSDTPCFIYPERANGVMYASQIRFVGGKNVRVFEFNITPACQNLRPWPQYCRSCCPNVCCVPCSPCCIPLWLFLLILAH